ncbi:hypothetical protein SAMN03159362_5462 [Pseudomonas sp. NFIX51]|jgi:hypothetical protein|nr:hypothetical protein H160_04319 [Pseudomonas sp. LAMO17WK12:I9]SMH61386.1 hypothetical protein SAMN03159362_5462 [Pseudomonas sp. NFIX51]SNY44617.1 hypothetical protein SAMN05660489_04231 [Pseudomonas sp. LAMO17WK12:I10]
MSDQKSLSAADFTGVGRYSRGKESLIDMLDKVVGQSD